MPLFFRGTETNEGRSHDEFIQFFANQICSSIQDIDHLTELSGMISAGHGHRITDQSDPRAQINFFDRMDPRYGGLLKQIFENTLAEWKSAHPHDQRAVVDFRDPKQIGKAQELSLAFGQAMQKKMGY